MKTTLSIAKLELSTLFYSPVAWLVLIVFTFQAGLQFTGTIENYEAAQQVGSELSDLTQKIFANPMTGGLFPDIQDKLYLYIPLLTMGLMSREISSGSIKLLLSSPIRISEIIWGKFLAIMAYGLLLMAILGLFIFAGSFSIASLDIKFALSGLLGLYLLLCAYSAIGLFMSCLTSYQVVAAISTLVILAALSYIGTLWQGIDFVRDLTYFLSISGRADQIIFGLISSKDVLYFVIIICLFLGCCLLKLQSDRESRSSGVKAGRYVLLFCVALLAGYLSSRPAVTGYYDMTVTKSNTLTPNSQQVVKQIKAPLTVTTYVNLLDRNAYFGMPEMRNYDRRTFEQFIRFLPDMKLSYVYYYDSSKDERLYKANPGLTNEDLAKKVAKSYRLDFGIFLPPSGIRKIIDLEPEENRFVRQMDLGGKKTFLRMFDDIQRFPSETEISAALKRLTITPPKAAFLTGDNERDTYKAGDKDYKMSSREITFRYALINQGFDVMPIDPAKEEIPDSLAVLVIADPKNTLGATAMEKIQHYIAMGGNLLIAGEPGKQEVLNPLIAPMGVSILPGTLIHESKDYAPGFILADLSGQSDRVSDTYKKLIARGLKVTMPGAAGLRYDDKGPYKITPVLVTSPANTWNTLVKQDQDSASVKYAPEKGDQKTEFPVVLSLTRNVGQKEQRVIISGDADFMSNAELSRYKPQTANFAFSSQLFRWLSNGRFPVDTRRPDTKDTNFTVSQPGILWLKIVFMGILPLVTLIVCVVLLVRRKRK